ncbi:small ribosomal subunit protein bS18m-like [Glandiceps talaboti]
MSSRVVSMLRSLPSVTVVRTLRSVPWKYNVQNVFLIQKPSPRVFLCTTVHDSDNKGVNLNVDIPKVKQVIDDVEDNKTEVNTGSVDLQTLKDLPDSNIVEDPYKPAAEKCILCKHNIEVNHKNVQLLSQFISPHTGRIYPRHVTGLCTYRQEEITTNIKRSRQMGFMAVVYKDPIYVKDPSLFDSRNLHQGSPR